MNVLRNRTRDRKRLGQRRSPVVVIPDTQPGDVTQAATPPIQERRVSPWKWWEWSDQDQIVLALGLVAFVMIVLPCLIGWWNMYSAPK